MAEALTNEMGGDHKHWLLEMERWQSYLRVWNEQQAALADEVAAIIQNHGRQLRENAQAVETLKRGIVDCERAMLAGTSVPREAAQRHAREAALHDEQRVVHERLKQSHHTLMAAQALLKGQPCREE
jgi:hypothetical protein